MTEKTQKLRGQGIKDWPDFTVKMSSDQHFEMYWSKEHDVNLPANTPPHTRKYASPDSYV